MAFLTYNSALLSEDLLHTRGIARSGFPPLTKIPYCCCLPVGVWAVSQSQCGRSPSQVGYASTALVGRYLTNQLMRRRSIHVHTRRCFDEEDASLIPIRFRSYFQQLSRAHGTGYLRVTHPFATKSLGSKLPERLRSTCMY